MLASNSAVSSLKSSLKAAHGLDDLVAQARELLVLGVDARLQPVAQLLFAVVAGFHRQLRARPAPRRACASSGGNAAPCALERRLVQQGLRSVWRSVAASLVLCSVLGAPVLAVSHRARSVEFLASRASLELLRECAQHVGRRLQPLSFLVQVGRSRWRAAASPARAKSRYSSSLRQCLQALSNRLLFSLAVRDAADRSLPAVLPAARALLPARRSWPRCSSPAHSGCGRRCDGGRPSRGVRRVP